MIFPNAELILNPDGSVYHLHLRPEDIGDTIITVGDPDRVAKVSQHFDRIELQKQKREFVTHTGYIGNKRVSVISTGIGTDNIDIVFNELDALVNIDLNKREAKANTKALDIIRIGTCGSLQQDLLEDTFIASAWGFGLEGLMHYYETQANTAEAKLTQALNLALPALPYPGYVFQASEKLLALFNDIPSGITATCGGFYAPQGRQLRYASKYPAILNDLSSFAHEGLRITNFEMETAGMYGMARLLGHEALSVSAILAHRPTGRFSQDPAGTEAKLIEFVLGKIQ